MRKILLAASVLAAVAVPAFAAPRPVEPRPAGRAVDAMPFTFVAETPMTARAAIEIPTGGPAGGFSDRN